MDIRQSIQYTWKIRTGAELESSGLSLEYIFLSRSSYSRIYNYLMLPLDLCKILNFSFNIRRAILVIRQTLMNFSKDSREANFC